MLLFLLVVVCKLVAETYVVKKGIGSKEGEIVEAYEKN